MFDLEFLMSVHSVGPFLAWSDLTHVCLVCKAGDAFGRAVRAWRMREWLVDATEREAAFLESFFRTGSWKDAAHRHSIMTLRYRHLNPARFLLHLRVDRRVSESEKLVLRRTLTGWKTAGTEARRAFESYVLNVLRYPPFRVSEKVKPFFDAFDAPFLKVDVMDLRMRRVEERVVIEYAGEVVLVLRPNAYGVLVGWPTYLFSNELYEWIKAQKWLTLLNFCNVCLYCGLQLKNAKAHSMNCMKQYAVVGASDIFKKSTD